MGFMFGRPPTPDCEFHAYLSYAKAPDELGRDNQDRVGRINDLLQSSGFHTCFDADQMDGDSPEEMCTHIEQSAAVCVFITEAYLVNAAGKGDKGADDASKKEFEYACQVRGVKRLVPVVMEPRCRNPGKWRGAVAMNCASILYVDLADDTAEAFDRGMQHLMKELVRCSEMQD